ncbi:MAG TPA: xanthine dehydrogenase family protein subunit M [Ktedonosporobacter sp.]|nr:xanthine dehydrogenase family protein subunit M [Ktedonosporobacter sp.]
MQPFSYTQVADVSSALTQLATHPTARLLAGGTNLIDLMKLGVEKPDQLIDISHLPLAGVEERADRLHIGALTLNSDLAMHRAVREGYPVLSEAILAGASPQLRNMATVGGNLMQRTRCFYFTDKAAPCNKRSAGSGCAAIAGENRSHAILGGSKQCIATHPSDMCVALVALDAVLQLEGPAGKRTLPLVDFHLEPGETPEKETQLQAGEIITGVELPKTVVARHSLYMKIRDRASYAFALVSVAAALEIEEGHIRNVRIALGGVATKPWRAYEAEAMLQGAAPTAESFVAAAHAATSSAIAQTHNGFKIVLAQRAIVRALSRLGEQT